MFDFCKIMYEADVDIKPYLQLGAITQEEFDAKKKQLLGI